MAKKESTFLNMVLTLFVITGVAALALGGVYNVTKEPIRLAQKEKAEKAIKEVIPAFDSIKTFKVMPEDGGKDSLTYNIGLLDGEIVGIAIESYSVNGYDPTPIKVMVGILPNGLINNTSVIQQKETPGLGTKMAEPKFKDQFMGIDPETFNMKVKKDGGEIDAITASTISSRAFSEAVDRAYQSYKEELK